MKHGSLSSWDSMKLCFFNTNQIKFQDIKKKSLIFTKYYENQLLDLPSCFPFTAFLIALLTLTPVLVLTSSSLEGDNRRRSGNLPISEERQFIWQCRLHFCFYYGRSQVHKNTPNHNLFYISGQKCDK